MLAWSPARACSPADSTTSDVDVFPIIAYDTNTGFGAGARAFFLSQLGLEESFDVLLFASTKGERWVRAVVALPDFECRQGTVYPWAVDVVADYDKYLVYNYFGVGNSSSFDMREVYSREITELSLFVSRGVLPTFVVQGGVRYRAVRNFNLESQSELRTLPPPENSGRADIGSLQLSLRYDSRDSYVRPSRGSVLLAEAEFAPTLHPTTSSGFRYALWAHQYTETGLCGSIVAVRAGLQSIQGTDLPVQFLLSLGSHNTLRGYLQDRFLDRVAVLFNAELRFEVIGRLGAVVGADAGKVWPRVSALDVRHWPWNLAAGLRWNMDRFVVRGDVGFSRETVGVYLNFGHIF